MYIRDGNPSWMNCGPHDDPENDNPLNQCNTFAGEITLWSGEYFNHQSLQEDAANRGQSGTENYRIKYSYEITDQFTCSQPCESWLELHEFNNTIEGIPSDPMVSNPTETWRGDFVGEFDAPSCGCKVEITATDIGGGFVTKEYTIVLRNKPPVYTQAGPFCVYQNEDSLISLSEFFSDPEDNDLYFTTTTPNQWGLVLSSA